MEDKIDRRARERNEHLKSIANQLEKAITAFNNANREFAKSLHPTLGSVEPLNTEAHTLDIPVTLDLETPDLRGLASLHKAEDGNVIIEIYFDGDDSRRLLDLVETDPIEALHLSSVVAE